jgi:hypothetical protein
MASFVAKDEPRQHGADIDAISPEPEIPHIFTSACTFLSEVL